MTAARSDLMALAGRLDQLAKVGFGHDLSDRDKTILLESSSALRLAASQPDREALIDVLVSEDLAFRISCVQGYLYGDDHVVRNVLLPAPQQELSRTKNAQEHVGALARAKAAIRADAILSLLSGAGSGADTKSDGGCNCSWGCVEADNCRRKLGPLPDWKQDQSETSRIKPRPSGADGRPPVGTTFTIEHDGFTGTVQGYYTTREGKKGVNLQQIGTRIVHVYGEKWLKTPDVKPAPIADSSECSPPAGFADQPQERSHEG